MKAVAFSALSLLPFAAPETSQAAEGPALPPANFRPLPAGTAITYQNIRIVTERVDGFTAVAKMQRPASLAKMRTTIGFNETYAVYGHSGPFSYTGESNWSATLDRDAKAALEGLWPLATGKKAAFRVEETSQTKERYKASRTWNVALEVTGTGIVTIAGQDYPVYVVVERASSPDPGIDQEPGRLDYTASYSYNPDSGLVLRYVRLWNSSDRPGDSAFWKKDFVSIEFGPGADDLKLVALAPAPKAPPDGGMAAANREREAEIGRLKQEIEERHRDEAARKVREVEAEKIRSEEIARLRREVEERRKVEARLTESESRELQAREAEMARLRREAEEARRADEARKAREAEAQRAREAEITRLMHEAEQAVKAREAEIARLRQTLAERRDDKTGDAATAFSGVDFGRYHALVIGIDNYKELPRLKTAISDARAVAEVLERDYGFSVTLLIDPDAREIVDKLDVYRETLGPKDNLLIYYAGHGWLDQEADRGYWLPVDAKPKRRSGWVSNATVSDTLKTLTAKHVMVVADSCYSGTLVRSADVGTRTRTGDYWKRMAEKWARVAITSGGLEPVADAGGGGHSPFAKAFIDGLRANASVIDGTQLFSQMRRPVMVAAQQTPQYADVREAGHDGGDFLFVRKR